MLVLLMEKTGDFVTPLSSLLKQQGTGIHESIHVCILSAEIFQTMI